MSLLPILEFPDPRLRKIAGPVTVFDEKLEVLIDDMFETMYDAQGIGLAATQVDVHKRLLVIDVSENKDSPLTFINPEFEVIEDELSEYDEGCLSVPGFYETVSRPSESKCARRTGPAKHLKWKPTAFWPYVFSMRLTLSLIHICRCRRIERCSSRCSPYH